MLDRRDLLRAAMGMAATRFLAAPALAAVEPARQRLADDPFTLGVASGDPATDGFVIWTRIMGLTNDASPVFEIAEDENFRRIVRSGRVPAPLSRAGAVHVELKGLRPGRRYYYRFQLGDAVSRIGRCATIADRPDRLRIALTSCQHWEQGWFSAYADMIVQDPDIALQVGDYIYEKSFGSGPDVRSFGTPDPVSLADYRARHALYRTDPHLAAAHAAMPFAVSWDDHEVENDYVGIEGVQITDPAAFLRRRAAAYQAYFEHMPLRPSSLLPSGEYRLYRTLHWGDLATLHMLDTRQYRTPHPCMTDRERGGKIVSGCAEVTDPSRSMLGATQERWLARELGRESARWSLVAQQTLFSRLFLPGGPDAVYSDLWDGYGASRDRLLDALSQPAVRNAVILSGDVHSFWVNDVKRDFADPRSATIATEIVTTCLASRNGPEALFGTARQLNPHVRFLDNRSAGYALLDVGRESIDIDLRRVDDLADPRSLASSLARFAIVNGRAGAQS